MKVIAIADYDGQPGELVAVIEVPYGQSAEKVFCKWLKKTHPDDDRNDTTLGYFPYEVESA